MLSMSKATTRDSVILKCSGLTVGYPGQPVLANLNFAIHTGEFVGIVGPNGSGKSTFLKGILGLIPILEGEVTISGATSIQGGNRRIGYLPQKSSHEADFPILVREVVLMGLYGQIGWLRRPQHRHKEQARQALETVQLADFTERPFAELSGGEQQRVLIARALASDPELLILDEPTAAVDITAQYEILEFLENLNRERGLTILMVSHDINEIVHFCDKVLLLNGNTGIFGGPTEVLTKENLRSIYGNRLFVYDHHGHPHIVVGDFHD